MVRGIRGICPRIGARPAGLQPRPLEADGTAAHAPRAMRAEHREADRQVLDGEAGGVEQRDGLGPRAPRRPRRSARRRARARRRGSRGRPRPRRSARRRGWPAPTRRRTARAPPRRPTSASALPGPSAPSMLRCRPGRRSRSSTTGSEPGRDAGHDVAGERVLAAARLPAELARQPAGGLGVGVEADARPVLGGRQAARRPGAVQAAADDADGAGVLAGELLRRHRRHGAGAQRGHRAHVHERERLAVSADGDADHPHHHRQPAPPGCAGTR